MQLEERERERERGSDSGSVCVTSVENSSFSCKKPRRKEKYHECKTLARFSKRVSSHKKGPVFSHVCPSHEGIRKFSFRRLAVGEKLFFKQETHARARRKREREKRGIRREWKWWKRVFSVFTRSSIQSVTGEEEEEEEEREEREKNNSKFEKPWSLF